MMHNANQRPSLFTLHFDNRKKQGRRGLKKCEAEGTLYTSGHVHIDTEDMSVTGFESLQQMLGYLSEFGDCTVIWTEGEEQTA